MIRSNQNGATLTRLTSVADAIRRDIAAGRLPLGARITIDDLARRYDASHMPIREALRQLHGEGLVLLEPNRGARVRDVDRDFIENLFATRSAVAVVLARQAAQHCTHAHLEALQAIEAERERHVAAADYAQALVANHRFHDTINAIARNPQAMAIFGGHWVLITALWHRYGYGPERFAGVASDHLCLLRALAAHDAEAAAVMTGAHNIKARYALVARIEAAARAAA